MAKHPRHPGFFGKLTRDVGHAAAGRVEETVARTADKVRQAARDVASGGRFTCSCGAKSCPGSFRSLRAQKAHAAKIAAGRWTSAKARAMGRKMGKIQDEARRVARGWREAAGLIDARGNVTAKGRARPLLSGQVKLRDLRNVHRHDRHAERTDRRAGKHESRATRADTRGRPEKAETHRQRAIETRQAHRQRWPERQPARPGPSPRPDRADGSGHGPEPSRTERTPR